jgi:predicted transposase/invertase (TIGR01784 family)
MADNDCVFSLSDRVKTDHLFFQIFQDWPALFFSLVGDPIDPTINYSFQSVEVKELSFRIDGVFLPPADQPHLPLYFLEIQMQRDPQLYARLFTEIFVYLRQYDPPHPWKAVVIFPRSAVDVESSDHYSELIQSHRLTRIYLDRLDARASLELQILQLVSQSQSKAAPQAQQLVKQAQLRDPKVRQALVNMVETIVRAHRT